MLEILGKYTTIYFYDIIKDNLEDYLLIYAAKTKQFYQNVDMTTLNYEIVAVSAHHLHNTPDFVNFEESIWLNWMGGNYLNNDFKLLNPTHLYLSNTDAKHYVDEKSSNDFILVPTFKSITGVNKKLQFALKAKQNETSKKHFDYEIMNLRMKMNEKISANRDINEAIISLNKQFNILNSYLKLFDLYDMNILDQSFIRDQKDIINFIEKIYNGENYYLDHILENQLDALVELESFAISQLKSSNDFSELELSINKKLKDLEKVVAIAESDKDEKKLPSQDIHRVETIPLPIKPAPFVSIIKPFVHKDKSHKEEKSIKLCFEILNGPDSSERNQAIDELRVLISKETLNKQTVIDRLLKYAKDYCPLIRTELFALLDEHGDSKDSRVLNVLFEGLQDSYQLAQFYACKALIKLNQSEDSRVINTLFNILCYSTHWIAQQAASILIDLNFYEHPQIKLVLENGQVHHDDYVKEHATNALTKLQKYKEAQCSTVLTKNNPKSSSIMFFESKEKSTRSKTTCMEAKSASLLGSVEDDRWYDGDKILYLLKHYFKDRKDIFVSIGINAYQDSGGTLRINLEDLQLQEALNLSLKAKLASTILLPINLGNLHWAALYIHFPNENRLKPTVAYFDPYGNKAPEQVLSTLLCIYSDLKINNVFQSPIHLQNDEYNCGPWIIAIFRSLVENGSLPPEDYNIEAERIEHNKLFQEYDLQEKAILLQLASPIF